MIEWLKTNPKQSGAIVVIIILGMLFMVSGPAKPDEEAIREIIYELVAAAEDREVGPFRKHLSEDLQDESGNSRQDLINRLRALYLRHSKISLTVASIDFDENSDPDLTPVNLTLLMSESTLPTDKGVFLLTFKREGSRWRVWRVRWGDGYGYQ